MIMDAFAPKLQQLLHRIAKAIDRRQSPVQSAVTLIAVSKTQSSQSVSELASLGQIDFGENYVQEGIAKVQALKPSFPHLVWHMIGPLQSNKTRLVAQHFDWVHTIDRLKIAQRLSEQRPSTSKPLQVLIQVNIDDETSKSGVHPSQLLALALSIKDLPSIELRGLMCIPAQGSVQAFAQMAHLFQLLNAHQLALDVLSMGMSHDFEAAIEHGASHVRVGSALFGPRVSSQID